MISEALAIHATAVGEGSLSVSPSPRWPAPSPPQQVIEPQARSAQVWSLPAASCTILSSSQGALKLKRSSPKAKVHPVDTHPTAMSRRNALTTEARRVEAIRSAPALRGSSP